MIMMNSDLKKVNQGYDWIDNGTREYENYVEGGKGL